MISGRRTRAAAAHLAATRSLDEQFCASPKRKDCKLDTTILLANEKLNARMIKADLIGFAKSRSPSITDYFNVQQRQSHQQTDITDQQQLHLVNRTRTILDIDENACHAFLVEHASSSDSDENTNIFLQAPVLHLNIDKSLNQASSIVINKHIDFTTLNKSPSGNNGLIPFPKATDSSGASSGGAITSTRTAMIYDKVLRSSSSSQHSRSLATSESESSSISSDSNSCDSGVVIDRTLELSPSKRRKPTTPHRILCPSPVKHVVAPIKSPSSALSNLNIGSKRNPKTKRR